MTRASRTPRRALTAAAVVIVLAAAGMSVVLAHNTHSGIGPAKGRRPASPAPLSGTEVGVPQLAHISLAGLRWGDYHGVRLPSSLDAGPRDTSGGLASGYSDTPLGALLAALNIAVRANAQWGPHIFGPTIRRQVTGPDAAALLASCRSAYAQASRAAHIAEGRPLGNAYVTEEAFRWVDWTPASATVDLVSAGPGQGGATARAVTAVQVIWTGGDWKVIAPPGGDWGNSAAELTSLEGYTIFPGQG